MPAVHIGESTTVSAVSRREPNARVGLAGLGTAAARLFNNGNGDFAPGDSTFLAAIANLARYKNPNATGDSLQMIEMVFENRTSLLVDPPDGKIPPLTPQARQRRAELEASTRRLPTGPEDLSDALRCITFGVPRLGGGFGAGPSWSRSTTLASFLWTGVRIFQRVSISGTGTRAATGRG